MLIGGDPTKGATAIGNNTYDGGAGFDTILVLGTKANDTLTVNQTGASAFTANLNGNVSSETIDAVEQVRLEAGEGDDTLAVNVNDALVATPAGSLRFRVIGDAPNASDRLIVRDDGLGDLVIHRQGTDGRSGSISVGPLSPVDYQGIESVDITPLDSVSGGTGTDGSGRLIVFLPDRFEQNDSRLVSTFLGSQPTFLRALSIDPGPIVLPAPFGTIPGDEDWFEFRPDKIGTFRFEVLFEEIGTLANGRAGLPQEGDINISVYRDNGTLIASASSTDDDEFVDISMATDTSYFLRVDGVDGAMNVYDLLVSEVDVVGPQIFDPDGVGGVNPIHITDDPTTAINESQFDLFDLKKMTTPTPRVDSITLHFRDILDRLLPNRAPGDVYGALDLISAVQPGNYSVRGDHSGKIAVTSVTVINNPVTAGQLATATVELQFAEPLPDDRFTLTVSERVLDPAGNFADGESNADQPIESPLFPTGDGIAGGDFVARFTVDSRPEIATWSQGVVYADINGNLVWDPEGQDNDATNRDFVFHFGDITDAYFAGNFAAAGAPSASGFDKLGAYGAFGGHYQFLLDTNDDGVGDTLGNMAFQVNAIPVAGDFNSVHPGDEIGAFDGTFWYFDLNGNNHIDVGERFTVGALPNGLPIVGDFNGDNVDDLATYNNDTGVVSFALISSYVGGPNVAGQDQLTFGFSGFGEKPVTGDVNLDGIDDIVMWVPGREGQLPKNSGEFHFLVSDHPAAGVPSSIFNPFSPAPLGNDLQASFGDDFALPLIGNFDPPVTRTNRPAVASPLTNVASPLDTNLDGRITALDALLVVNELPDTIRYDYSNPIRLAASLGGRRLDANGDGRITALDALRVINGLDSHTAAESEASTWAFNIDDVMADDDEEDWLGLATDQPDGLF
jgi:hypothetical protein